MSCVHRTGRVAIVESARRKTDPLYDAAMAYDVDLADRIRELTGDRTDVVEKAMFGGLAFIVGGHMAISASGQGGILVRVDPATSDKLTGTTNAVVAVMGGRSMAGWLRIDGADVRTQRLLKTWVTRSVTYVESLPPKKPATRRQ